jgi:hypothetical protein
VAEVFVEEIRAHVGKELGVSRWFEIEQARIDAFQISLKLCVVPNI